MDDMYGGTNRYFRKIASKSGIETSYVDATNPTNIERAIKPSTKMVFHYLGSKVKRAVSDIISVLSPFCFDYVDVLYLGMD